MYGLEIQDHMKLKGFNIGPGQLYPALKRLEEEGALEVREEERAGANRKFYRTTPEGRNIVIQHITHLMILFEHMLSEKLSFVPDHIAELVDLNKPGIIIADLSIGSHSKEFLLIYY